MDSVCGFEIRSDAGLYDEKRLENMKNEKMPERS
jgi:hypothetical protein